MSKPKLCNIEYKDDDTGVTRTCQGDATGPRPARWAGMGVKACEACWKDLQPKLVQEYGRGHVAFARAAIGSIFRQVR